MQRSPRLETLKVVLRQKAASPSHAITPIEWEASLSEEKITIGRHPSNSLVLEDPMVSGFHCKIESGYLEDCGSSNGTLLKSIPLKKSERKLLNEKDEICIGETKLIVEKNKRVLHKPSEPNSSRSVIANNKLNNNSNNNRIPLKASDGSQTQRSKRPTSSQDVKLSPSPPTITAIDPTKNIDHMIDDEFDSIIGHTQIKQQLKQFYKKIQLDRIRSRAKTNSIHEECKEANPSKRDGQPATSAPTENRMYHMLFTGPPGVGKSTIAKIVSKICLQMGLLKNNKLICVGNALELIGSFVGQTPERVDAKVEEARDGILFIDEAYSIIKGGDRSESGNGGQFGREAVDTLMKHMDPPSCLMIFAGYEKPMQDFLRTNDGLARRIPYRFEFLPYTDDQLVSIFIKMCESKGERTGEECIAAVRSTIAALPAQQKETQNGGLVANLLSFAQLERDDRIDIAEAEKNPLLATTLKSVDIEKALLKVQKIT